MLWVDRGGFFMLRCTDRRSVGSGASSGAGFRTEKAQRGFVLYGLDAVDVHPYTYLYLP